MTSKISFQSTNQILDLHKSAPPVAKKSHHRKILPLNETPSLTVTSTQRVVDPILTQTKVMLRIQTYYINALAEILYQTPFQRGKTALQGTSAPKGWQAAHACLTPATQDDHTTKVIDHIVDVGVTPTKTKPFLICRIGLTVPEEEVLQENHTDAQFVTQFVLDRLPQNGEISIFAHSRYNWNCNATMEGPDESNEYDSELERQIEDLLKELQTLRLAGTITAEESTEKLAEWLKNYYDKSIQDIEQRINHINAASAYFENIRAFELSNITTPQLSPQDFMIYLQNVHFFLQLQDSLSKKISGCPPCNGLKKTRPDLQYLKTLHNKSLDPKSFNATGAYFFKYRDRLSQPMSFDRDFFHKKYALYLDEAKIQRETSELFLDPCTIPHLKTAIFGIMEEGKRRAPSEEELKEQIYALSKLASPMKQKTLLNQTKTIQPPSRKRIIFEDENTVVEPNKKQKVESPVLV